jgi:hypothetical protein
VLDLVAELGRLYDVDVEPCINGQVATAGAYFGQDVRGIIDRLLGEQLSDGGWNCEAPNGSTRSSFNTTICVLEALLEHERATGGSREVTEARLRGEEYLLNRAGGTHSAPCGCWTGIRRATDDENRNIAGR